MIIEKISMVDALNMEMKELMDSYQQILENMSKEELISEIGNLLVDKGILLDGRDNQITELKEEIKKLKGALESEKNLHDLAKAFHDEKCAEFDSLCYDYNKQRDEIERLTKEKKTAWQKFKQKVDENIELSMLLDKRAGEKSELQKQVKDLTEQRDVFKRLFESANTTHFSTEILIETMNTFYREQAEHLAELKIEQSVTDTAKEIYEAFLVELRYYDKNDKLDKPQLVGVLGQIVKSKGVEVE